MPKTLVINAIDMAGRGSNPLVMVHNPNVLFLFPFGQGFKGQ